LIEYLGELVDEGKTALLGQARALLFPIDWPEPFGLVMIEALACGTPVIAYGRGSVPEIIEHGRNGFIVCDEEETAQAVARLSQIDRRECRKSFEQRFTVEFMARGYLDIYERLIRARGTAHDDGGLNALYGTRKRLRQHVGAARPGHGCDLGSGRPLARLRSSHGTCNRTRTRRPSKRV
jgi:hypothetical protein